MNDAILLAVELAFSISLEMIIWSVGLVAFTTHFLVPEQAGKKRRWILLGIIALYLVSICFGALCLMSFTGELSDRKLPQRLDLYERLGDIRWAAIWQASTFLIATVLTAFLAILRTFALPVGVSPAVMAGPGQSSPTEGSPTQAGDAPGQIFGTSAAPARGGDNDRRYMGKGASFNQTVPIENLEVSPGDAKASRDLDHDR